MGWLFYEKMTTLRIHWYVLVNFVIYLTQMEEHATSMEIGMLISTTSKPFDNISILAFVEIC